MPITSPLFVRGDDPRDSGGAAALQVGDDGTEEGVPQRLGDAARVVCEKAIAKEPSMLNGEPDRSAQITVYARVSRLSRRDATYLPGATSCAATP